MAWNDTLRQASFRGINFFVPTATNSGGKRNALFEFPKQEIPYVEEMGRKAKRYLIEAIIVSDEYFPDRDRLIEALDRPGAGKLVHPYLGTLDVICETYSFTERVSEMRMVTFSIEFLEAGVLQFPVSVIDTTSTVALKKKIALDNSKNSFLKVYNSLSLIRSDYENLESTVDKGLSLIQSTKQSVSAVSSFKRDLENLIAKVSAAILSIEDLVTDITDLMTFGTDSDDSSPATPVNASIQLDEMVSMFEFVPTVQLPDDDPSSLFSRYFQENAVINALGLMSIISYDSVDQAYEIREQIFQKLEEIILQVSDDELYNSLTDLQTEVSRDLDTRVVDLPRLASLTPQITLPAIVHSYNLYGNISEESDIIKRNKISHPNFVPGGVPLKVKINV